MVYLSTLLLLHIFWVEKCDHHFLYLLFSDGECFFRIVQLHLGLLCSLQRFLWYLSNGPFRALRSGYK